MHSKQQYVDNTYNLQVANTTFMFKKNKGYMYQLNTLVNTAPNYSIINTCILQLYLKPELDMD